MKRTLLSLALLLAASPAFAAQHTLSLSFNASTDSTTANPGTTQIYWAQGACPASGIAGLTWNQATATGAPGYTAASPYSINLPSAGTYCAYVTFTQGGAISVPSNTAGGSAAPFPVGTVSVSVQ